MLIHPLPYCHFDVIFIAITFEFYLDTYIQKSRKNFMDSRNRRNLSRINDELYDVQRIMMQNIDDILQRGEQLSGMEIPHNFLLI